MLCEKLVDTGVRGLIYEAAGPHRETGEAIVRYAHERWEIPIAIVDVPPADCAAWQSALIESVNRLLGL